MTSPTPLEPPVVALLPRRGKSPHRIRETGEDNREAQKRALRALLADVDTRTKDEAA